MKLGDPRVATEDPRLDLQRARLKEAGCGRLFEEKVSGAARQRPALERLLQELRADGRGVTPTLPATTLAMAAVMSLQRTTLDATPAGQPVIAALDYLRGVGDWSRARM